MNRKIKVGDIVVLVEGPYLDALEINLAKEKHLFEVEGVANDIANLRSTSANLETEVHVECIRHATLKEQYLRDGNSIVFDGVGYLVSGNKVVSLRNGLYTNYFDSNLLAVTDRKPITKVFNNLSKRFVNIIDENHKLTTVLWEYSEPEIELTSDEIIILKNVDERFKYIVRDSIFDSLCLFEKEPTANGILGTYVSDVASNWQHLGVFNHLFKNITFESGAHSIDDLIKGNEKMKEKVIDTYYWLGYLKNYEVKGFIYDEDTEVLTLYTYTDDEKDTRTIVDLSYADSPIQLETLTDEEINEHLLETYEEYVHIKF